MKNFTKTITNKTLFKTTRWLIMALMLLVGTSSVWGWDQIKGGMTFYLKPSSNWKEQSAHFAIYLCNGDASSTWVAMTEVSGESGVFEATVPETDGKYHKNIIFVRINPNYNVPLDNNWTGKWNQTSDLEYTDSKNYYEGESGTWDSQGADGWESQKTLYYLMGLTDWVHGDNLSSSVSKNLAEGTHNFKVRDSQGNWYGNNGTMTRNGTSVQSGGWTMSTNEGNCGITADVAGDYTFTFVASTKKLTVTYPELPCYTTSDVEPGTISSNATNNTICGSGSVELTLSNTTTKDDLTRTIQWQKYIGNAWSNITNATSTTYTETISATTKYRAKVTWTKSECTTLTEYASESGFTITVNARPGKPTFDAIAAQCGSYTLPTEDKNKVSVNWYDSNGNKITSVIQSGTYYAEAVDGTCVSENRTDVEITIKTKPTISISGSEKAVLYEEVTLTATATDGATVKWYEGAVEKSEGLTYVVTSETATSKTITAKAFLNGCESDASYIVNFEAEGECEPEIITHTNKTKVRVQSPWSSIKIYAHSGQSTGDWPGVDMTAGTGEDAGYYVYTFESVSSNFKVIFNNGNSNGENQTVSGTATKGKVCTYTIGANSCSEDNNSRRCLTVETTTDYKTTGDVIISAPAAKTISVSTTDGEGNIIFSGQVVKTGCADALTYGFAYSTDANADKNNWTKVECANTGNTAGIQYNGEKTGIEVDGTYYVCAYITNSAGTTYGAVTEITISTTKTSISNVTLNYCDEYGEGIPDPNPMCKGATAYVKLSYVGSKYSDIKWLVEGVETNLVTDKGDGVWSYIIQGDGSLSVELRNDANKDNEDNPTWATSNKLSFTMKEEPTAPYISIDPASGVLCEGYTATITVTNPSTDCAYKLVDESPEAEFVEYESGDLKYSVGSVGKYYVAAKHIACPTNEYTSNQVEINQIISTSASISIEPATSTTTPWEPVTITVNPEEGYVYELSYTNNNLAGVDGVIIKQNGDSYTYYIPRPDSWDTGDATPVRTAVEYGIKAQLKVDGEASQCDLNYDTATIQLKDEDNENCPQ